MTHPASPPVRIRELRRGEYGPVDTVFAGLSPQSRYLRFHTGMPHLPNAVREALVAVDGVRHVALVAESDRSGEPIGIARFIATTPDRAELAISIIDAWHRRGVGRRLLDELQQRAVEAGYRELTAVVLPNNGAIRGVLHEVFPDMRTTLDDGVYEVTCPIGSGAVVATTPI